ncbi:MAG: restriction endonuclease subunit S [Eubacteriales bacterium]|nr:restriction endonuclease subunit S [Eubacteriales bacterium]
MSRLGDAFESQITGEWGSECTESENGTKVLRTTNFTSEGKINYDDIVIRSISESKVKKKRLHFGDIILEKSGGTEKTPVGRVVFCDEAIENSIYLCNNFTQAMRVNQAIAIPKYVFYFMWNLHASGRTDLLQNKTTGIRNLQVKSYLNENCPLPSLDEQRRVVAVLDKVNGLIAKRKQQLNKLDELVKSRFIELFGDPVSNPHGYPKVSLSELAEIKIGPFGSLLHKEDYIVNGHALVNPSHIVDGEISIDNKLTVSDDKFSQLSAYHLQVGDVVMGRRGEMGRCAVVQVGGLLCGTGSLLIRTKGDVTADYLQKIISFTSFKKTIEDMAVGQTMPNLNVPIVSRFQIIKPPIEVQKAYYTFVEQTDKSKLTIQQSLDKLEVLKKKLMQDCFG